MGFAELKNAPPMQIKFPTDEKPSFESIDEMLDHVVTLVELLPGVNFQDWDFQENHMSAPLEIHTIEEKFGRRVYFRMNTDIVTAKLSVDFEKKHVSVEFFNTII